MDSRISICVVTQQLGNVVSGVGTYASSLIRHLVQDGHDLTVVAPASERPLGDLPYRFVGVPQPLMQSNHARWITLSISFARALSRLDKGTHFDLIHFTDAREACFTKNTTPLVGTVNDTYSALLDSPNVYRQQYHDWISRWLYYLFVHFMEHRSIPRLNGIIANSYFTAQTIQDQYQVPSDKLYTCYYCTEAERFLCASQKRAEYLPHPPRIICVGGNFQRKGIPDLISASRIVLDQVPDTEFCVVGRDANAPALEQDCMKLGVSNQFHFLGWKSPDDLIDLYAQSTLYVMPSLTEAFGIVFLEAMAAGLPVIGTSVGGIPEIIQDGVNGRLVPPRNPTALADTILGLIRQPEEQERLRRGGLERIQQFTSDNGMKCTYSVYESVLSRFKG